LHYSGRLPGTQCFPSFDGEKKVTIYANAGDVYLVNHQLWHRGAQDTSDRVRLMAVTEYGRRFMQQRFYPFLNYKMPKHVIEGADERLLSLLGKHPKGPFG
jgi:ectoine hydroxylase-related dioxygenase (phytanoyl-CoA dioxygenase family)